MKTLHSIAFVAALGLSSVSGFAASETPAAEETATKPIEYVASMTGVT